MSQPEAVRQTELHLLSLLYVNAQVFINSSDRFVYHAPRMRLVIVSHINGRSCWHSGSHFEVTIFPNLHNSI